MGLGKCFMTERMRMASRLLSLAEGGQGSGREFDVLLITAGQGNGWEFPAEVLQASAALWEGVSSFVDHAGLDDYGRGTRSVRDVAGVVLGTRYDAELQGMRGRLRLSGPEADLLSEMFRQHLRDKVAGILTPDVGLSADLEFTAGAKRQVAQILKVFSVDIVYGPARGGRLMAALARRMEAMIMAENIQQEALQGGDSEENSQTNGQVGVEAGGQPSGGQPSGGQPHRAAPTGSGGDGSGVRTPSPNLSQRERNPGARGQAQAAQPAAAGAGVGTLGVQPIERAVDAARIVDTELVIESVLATSGLPEDMRQAMREELASGVLDGARLRQALARYQRLAGAMAERGVVRGVGTLTQPLPGGEGHNRGRVSGMRTDWERLGLAFERLFGLEGEYNSDVPRLSGIREGYLLLTGDYDFHGRFDATRVGFANATTTTMAELVRNVMNKVVVQQWELLGRAGYMWWQQIVHEEDFESLQQVSWVTVGGFSNLSTVAEGGTYTELV